MRNGDFSPRLGNGRKVIAYAVLYLEFALILKKENGHCRELLGYRPNPELRRGDYGYLQLAVGHSVAGREYQLPIRYYTYRAVELELFQETVGTIGEGLAHQRAGG